MVRKKIVAGNWKMNLSVGESQTLVKQLHDLIGKDQLKGNLQAEVVVAPTHLSIFPVAAELQKCHSPIKAAAQNVHYLDNGAYTGEISVAMLQDLNIPYCIVGHSERRTLFGETDETVNLKVKKLWEAGIIPIFCIGETLAERKADRWQEVVSHQIELGLKDLKPEEAEKTVIAYEPVWAIGTGMSASPTQAQEVHQFIRKKLEQLPHPESITILYGGSVNAKNAGEIFSQPDIDGGLVGGASLKAEEFTAVIRSLN